MDEIGHDREIFGGYYRNGAAFSKADEELRSVCGARRGQWLAMNQRGREKYIMNTVRVAGSA